MKSRYRYRKTVGDYVFPGIAVAIIVLVLAGLGYTIWYDVNDPGEGTITSKEHSASYTSCTHTNNSTSCHTVPECWRLVYHHNGHDGDACVPGAEWSTYQVGDYYPRGKDPKYN